MDKTIVKSLLNNAVTYAEFEFSTEPPWLLKITIPNAFDFSREAADLFEAFSEARKQASKINLSFLCNGARENVYPSPMMRDMAGGLVAYCLTLGKQARRSDTVRIFEETNEKIVSVDQQTQFHEKWLASL